MGGCKILLTYSGAGSFFILNIATNFCKLRLFDNDNQPISLILLDQSLVWLLYTGFALIASFHIEYTRPEQSLHFRATVLKMIHIFGS